MKFIKSPILMITLLGMGLLFLGLVMANLRITRQTSAAILPSAEEVPSQVTVLLLGCPTHLSNGRPNLFYQRRLDAAETLYRAGKIQRLIASDHNPEHLQRDLVARGVPLSLIQLDPAGVSTLESIRSYAELHPNPDRPLVIISQPDHLSRALYMAHHFGIPAQGYAARDVAISQSFKTKVREALARVKALLNLHVLRVPLARPFISQKTP